MSILMRNSHNPFRKKLPVLLLVGAAAFSPFLTAENELLNVQDKAIEYVLNHDGIAVVVSIGTEDPYTGDQVGEAVIKKFQSMHDVDMVNFARQSSGAHGYLEFYMRHGRAGPYSGDTWDTPEEVKSLFDRLYLAYLKGLKSDLQTDHGSLETELDELEKKKAENQHFLDEISSLISDSKN